MQFSLDIVLRSGQKIKARMQTSQKETRRFAILATIGVELNEVKRFPFIYLKDAGLLPVKGTSCTFLIDGNQMALKKTPIHVEGQKRYKSVFSFNRLPFFLNEEQNSKLVPVTLESGQSLQKGNAEYLFINNDGNQELLKILYTVNGHSAQCRFSPGFPDIAALKKNSKVSGRFCLGIDEIDGIIGGKYFVLSTDDLITIEMKPEKCWGPIGKKNWASAYSWSAQIHRIGKKHFEMTSKWIIQ